MTLLRSNNIRFGRLDYDDIQIVPKRLVTETQLMRDGDIAVCMSNGSKSLVGKAAAFFGGGAGKITVGAFCSIFRPEVGCVPEFVRQLFQSGEYRKNLDLALAGSAINNLRNRDLEDFGCDVPPECEQRKIAVILDTIDTAIHETEALIAKLKAVKQGLLHDLLTRGIDANGELRPPQSEAPHLYQPSLLGMIPVDWNCLRLESLVSSGCPITYGVVQPGPEIENGVPFIRGGDIFDGRIAVNQLRTISRAVSRSYARTQLQGGELLMSLVGYPGEVGIVPDDLVGANIARQAALISLPSPTLTRFVMHYLLSIAGKKQVLGQSLGSAQQVVNLGDLRGVRILLPNDEEMKEISRRVDSIDTRLHKDLDLLSKLVQSKVALMDDLLTGRVRVTPLLTDATA
ncbi:restriction endonuclease subunit S [Xanthomonas campestris pv. incanae]|uniref:restriction endonuclease subunit S n=1 Tax=Xanthomonas campestris TaxID=339 RepID=UPI00236842E4|nr:restriction endonuclease subunit S [Xanthomonas campestris]WDK24688.1 restriction endonuclease subunit S [Xanthomonas campestris pv. incanae]